MVGFSLWLFARLEISVLRLNPKAVFSLLLYMKCQFSALIMQEIVNEVCDNMENVINEVSQGLPAHFPAHICDPIFAGMREIKNRCIILV